MAKNNFPKTEKEFHAWFSNFQQSFASNYKKYGYKSSDVSSVNRWYRSWQNSYHFWSSFNQFYSWYTKFHNSEFTNYKSFLSNYWSQIQGSPNWDGNWQKWFGVTAPKTSATKAKGTTSKPKTTKSKTTKAKTTKSTTKKTTTTASTAPTFWSEWKSGKLWLFAGPSKTGGWKMPTWAKFCTFEYKTEGGAWKKFHSGTKPYGFNSSSTKKVYYRAYWTNSNGSKGAYSKPMAWDWSTSKSSAKRAA